MSTRREVLMEDTKELIREHWRHYHKLGGEAAEAHFNGHHGVRDARAKRAALHFQTATTLELLLEYLGEVRA
jgi:hypothetical protein